jgi:hypothetical protein
MATRKKPENEGLAALVAPPVENQSIQDITMLDWYVAFSLMSMPPNFHPERAAVEAFERAEAVMAERAKRA